jgi:hypothetical protein
MLLTPSAVSLAGVVPVVVACGGAYIGVGIVGLVLHANWVEMARERLA